MIIKPNIIGRWAFRCRVIRRSKIQSSEGRKRERERKKLIFFYLKKKWFFYLEIVMNYTFLKMSIIYLVYLVWTGKCCIRLNFVDKMYFSMKQNNTKRWSDKCESDRYFTKLDQSKLKSMCDIFKLDWRVWLHSYTHWCAHENKAQNIALFSCRHSLSTRQRSILRMAIHIIKLRTHKSNASTQIALNVRVSIRNDLHGEWP